MLDCSVCEACGAVAWGDPAAASACAKCGGPTVAVDEADPDGWPASLDVARWYDRGAVDPSGESAYHPADACTFILGSKSPNWLYAGGVGKGRLSGRVRRPDGPVFISAASMRTGGGGTVRRVRPYPAGDTGWALDSGGFMELRDHGAWRQSAAEYAADVTAWAEQTGTLAWAAIQDHMCERVILDRTGGTIAEHQARTVRSFSELQNIAPGVRWLPVLQGWEPADYIDHLRQYRDAGHDLRTMELVGIGSVCRRNTAANYDAIADIVAAIYGAGCRRLHGFGLALAVLPRVADRLGSSDSLAWSYGARRRNADKGARNSIHTAEAYRARVLAIDGVDSL